GRLDEAEYGASGRGLAGPGLADQPERLAAAEPEGDVVDGAYVVGRAAEEPLADREVHLEAADIEERIGRHVEERVGRRDVASILGGVRGWGLGRGWGRRVGLRSTSSATSGSPMGGRAGASGGAISGPGAACSAAARPCQRSAGASARPARLAS